MVDLELLLAKLGHIDNGGKLEAQSLGGRDVQVAPRKVGVSGLGEKIAEARVELEFVERGRLVQFRVWHRGGLGQHFRRCNKILLVLAGAHFELCNEKKAVSEKRVNEGQNERAVRKMTEELLTAIRAPHATKALVVACSTGDTQRNTLNGQQQVFITTSELNDDYDDAPKM